jgi:hypothetical protein
MPSVYESLLYESLLKRIIEEKAKHEMVEKKVAKSLTIKIDSEQTRLV